MNLRSSFSLSWAFSCWIIKERTLEDANRINTMVSTFMRIRWPEREDRNASDWQWSVLAWCLLCWVVPIAHIVKVLRELSQVRTLLLILLLGPKQHLRNLKGEQEGLTDRRAQHQHIDVNQHWHKGATVPRFYRRAQHQEAWADLQSHGCGSHGEFQACWDTKCTVNYTGHMTEQMYRRKQSDLRRYPDEGKAAMLFQGIIKDIFPVGFHGKNWLTTT